MTEDQQRRLREVERQVAELETGNEHIERLLRELKTDVAALRADWTKARGFVAGVVITISALWGVALAVWKLIADKIPGS